MIPIRDDNPTTKPSVIVPLLIAANAIVFLFVQPTLREAGPGGDLGFFVCNAAIPYEVSRLEALGDADQIEIAGNPGQIDPREIRAFEQQECPDKNVWLSVLFSMFMHGGWAHIIFNMLFLWVFGNNVEDATGKLAFPLFYLACGFLATYTHVYLGGANDTIPLIGASGAIAGVLGAYLIMYPSARVTTLVIFFFITWIELPAVVVLGLWFVIQLFQQVGSTTGGTGGGVAYLAHIGGFVAGMGLIWLFRPRRHRPPRRFIDV